MKIVDDVDDNEKEKQIVFYENGQINGQYEIYYENGKPTPKNQRLS